MLPRNYKLKKKNDFKGVFEKGRYFQGKFIKIKFLKNDLESSRFGLMVGLKVSKKAVERNKIKRWLEESIQSNLEKIKNGFDVIIMVNPEILERKYQEVKEELINLLEESNLIVR